MRDNPRNISGRTAIISAIVVVVIALAGAFGLYAWLFPPTGDIQQSRMEQGANCEANCDEPGSSNSKPAAGTSAN